MTNPIQILTRTALVTVALSVAALSLPAFAGGNDEESLLKKQDYKCQSINKAARALKKWNYKHVEYQGEAKSEYLYIFTADKKRNGEYYSWYITYDACDREIVAREPAKKEESPVEM